MNISMQKNPPKPTYEEILDHLKKIAIETLRLTSEQISKIRPDSPIVETLLLDSLTQAELIFEIEDQYGFEFELENINNLKTIKDLISIIQTCATPLKKKTM